MTTEERNQAIRNTIDAISARLRPEDTGDSSRVDTNYVGANISDEAVADFVEALDEDARLTDSINIEPSEIIPNELNFDNSAWIPIGGHSTIKQITPLDSKPIMLDLIEKALRKKLINSKDILQIFKKVGDSHD